jgi:hypothetical protein
MLGSAHLSKSWVLSICSIKSQNQCRWNYCAILDEQNIHPTYTSVLSQLGHIIHQDPKVKYKGNLFEAAVASYMVETWRALTIAELPFLAPYRHMLPPWCAKAKISWTKFGSSDQVNDRSHGELTPDIRKIIRPSSYNFGVFKMLSS